MVRDYRKTFEVISLMVNGEPRNFAGSVSVQELLDDIGAGGQRIAVEKNGEIVPRSRFKDEILLHGDRLEIVIAVGGG